MYTRKSNINQIKVFLLVNNSRRIFYGRNSKPLLNACRLLERKITISKKRVKIELVSPYNQSKNGFWHNRVGVTIVLHFHTCSYLMSLTSSALSIIMCPVCFPALINVFSFFLESLVLADNKCFLLTLGMFMFMSVRC